MSSVRRVLTISVIENAESVRLVVVEQDRIGESLIPIFGQSRDAIALPSKDPDQWRRDMMTWALEEL
jgi:16S rRNA C1402 (ribose-2'-O) methylase RsmI